MPAERLPMRKVREVLRQKYACGASERVIARSLGIGRTAVGEYIRRAAVIGITWPVPDELDDAALERKLFAPAGYNPPRSKPLPDWAHVHAELRRRGVTLALLWQEYRGQHPDGYGYSRFCDLYGEWRRGVTATMRQTHVAGEKLFVDFAGDTMPVFDAITGEVRDSQDLRRGAGGLELHLCRSPLQRGAAGLDRGPRQRARVPRRGAEGDRLRQPQGRGHDRQPIRAGGQPHLPGPRRPLRHDHHADAAAQAARQGQGRGRGADRRALDSGAAARPALLLAGRAERRDPRAGR